ncbi:MAG: heparan N-sulfatase [Sphingobacteriaceae bacterium]|jgi:arylsulfatase A-like enzyme|nr:heparan N-sulfatase [Sphingobacteriaceae bacterium]
MQNFRNMLLVAFAALLIVSANAGAQQKSTVPNILFCLADDASFEHFSANGSKWVKTPNFDRIAKDELLFLNAYTPNAKCAPSRASILTGRNSWQLEELGNHLAYWPAKYVSVMEVMGQKYFTGYTGKGWAPGDPGKINGKPREVTGKAYQSATLVPPTSGIANTDYATNFKNFLGAKPKGQPFFFWFGSKEPHREYEYGSGAAKGSKSLKDIDKIHQFWPDADSVRMDMLDYAYEVEYFDKQLGRILEVLDQSGEAGNTIVVITSDNGMPFPRIKGFEYELSNHMPLAIRWPNGIQKPGRKIEDFVSFIDFTPTFLTVSGVKPDAAEHNQPQGKSLTNIFNSNLSDLIDPTRNYVLLGQERHDVGRPHEAGYPIRSIIKDGYMYIRNFEPSRWPAGNPETGYLNTDGGPTKTVILNQNRRSPGNIPFYQLSFAKRGAEEFYNIKEDRDCVKNLINDASLQTRIAAMRSQLLTELKQQGDPRMFGKGYLFDNYPPFEGFQFYSKFMNGQRMTTPWVNSTDYETDPRIIKGD